MITSHEIKNMILKYCLTGGLIACTELQLNNADVFSVNKRHYSTEFEIKTAKSDLKREFAAIEAAINEQGFYEWHGIKRHREPKVLKHYRYINKTTTVTNYYCFAVTEELTPVCAAFLQKHKLPYGLLSIEEYPPHKERGYKDYHVIKEIFKPKRLHSEKCSQDVFEKVARRACWEAFNLRIGR